jgi:FkbM family methyltransferase
MTAAESAKSVSPVRRVWRFLNRPLSEKAIWLWSRWHAIQLFWQNIPVPIRLPFGAWWLARDDHIGRLLRKGEFEPAELRLVARFLQRDMVALDIGAHHGLYTLLASGLVGARGKVLAFEPSDRERKALSLHIALNRCKNVEILSPALGKEAADADLYVVEPSVAGCNSLRPPAADVPGSSSPRRVRVVRLDDQLSALKIDHVDFIKLDVEGAELAVLQGARQVLSRHPRPVILAEVQDIRTAPWGYRAREIITLLEHFNYNLFQPSEHGGLRELSTNIENFDLNVVAIPTEQTQSVLARISALEARSGC